MSKPVQYWDPIAQQWKPIAGLTGTTFTPHIERTAGNANLSFTNDGGLPNPEPVDIPLVTIDPTLTKSGQAADAGAVERELIGRIKTIESFTFGEAGLFYRDQYPDGTPYSIDWMALKICLPVGFPKNSALRLKLETSGGYTLITTLRKATETSNMAYGWFYISKENGYLRFYCCRNMTASSGMEQGYFSGYDYINRISKNDTIVKIEIMDEMPAGTKIDILGVRA